MEISEQEWQDWREDKCTLEMISCLKEAIEGTKASRSAACEYAVFNNDRGKQTAWHKNGYLEACTDMLEQITGE